MGHTDFMHIYKRLKLTIAFERTFKDQEKGINFSPSHDLMTTVVQGFRDQNNSLEIQVSCKSTITEPFAYTFVHILVNLLVINLLFTCKICLEIM